MIIGNAVLFGREESSVTPSGENDSVWTGLASKTLSSVYDPMGYAAAVRPYAFYSCASLRSVSFPAARKIGDYAFYSCRYCEKCKHLFEGDHCQNCRKSHVRPVQPEDPCFLVEKGAPWNGMLTDVLRQNDIPFLTDGRMGAGLATYAGPRLESSRFFVRFDDLDRANVIVDELFGEDSPR